MRFLLMTSAALALALIGCDKESANEDEAPTVAAGEAIAPTPIRRAHLKGGTAPAPVAAPKAKPLPPGTGNTLPKGHPPIGAMPKVVPAPTVAAPADPAAQVPRISGQITIDPAHVALAKPGAVVFIMVREPTVKGPRGRLLAVQRHAVTGPATFPLQYVITDANLMQAGTTLSGDVDISARIDQDANPMTKVAGDLVGKAGAHTVGAVNVNFTLNQPL